MYKSRGLPASTHDPSCLSGMEQRTDQQILTHSWHSQNGSQKNRGKKFEEGDIYLYVSIQEVECGNFIIEFTLFY